MLRAVAVALVAVTLAAAAAWWWWTAPALAPAAELAAALQWVPAPADGAVAIARPVRFGRWLFRHPQAAAVALVAAPDARRAGERLAPVARALAHAASGPLVVWWRSGEAAVAATVDAGARHGLAELAARAGLAAAEPGGAFAVATTPDLLAGGTGPATGVAGGAELAGDATALARVAGRSWRVRCAADALRATAGGPVAPPSGGAGSSAVTAAAGRLLGAAGLGRLGLGERAALLVGPDGGWALRLDDVRPSPELRRLLGGDAGGAAAVHRSVGPFGEMWWRADDGLVLASGEAWLRRVAEVAAGEAGSVRGAEVAAALRRVATALSDVPGFAARSQRLAAAADAVAGVRVARWRLDAAGGMIEMEW